MFFLIWLILKFGVLFNLVFLIEILDDMEVSLLMRVSMFLEVLFLFVLILRIILFLISCMYWFNCVLIFVLSINGMYFLDFIY